MIQGEFDDEVKLFFVIDLIDTEVSLLKLMPC
ncbi:hypothetical protein NUACC26_055500 [Scytonema sp. NUACC26]